MSRQLPCPACMRCAAWQGPGASPACHSCPASATARLRWCCAAKNRVSRPPAATKASKEPSEVRLAVPPRASTPLYVPARIKSPEMGLAAAAVTRKDCWVVALSCAERGEGSERQLEARGAPAYGQRLLSKAASQGLGCTRAAWRTLAQRPPRAGSHASAEDPPLPPHGTAQPTCRFTAHWACDTLPGCSRYTKADCTGRPSALRTLRLAPPSATVPASTWRSGAEQRRVGAKLAQLVGLAHCAASS